MEVTWPWSCDQTINLNLRIIGLWLDGHVSSVLVRFLLLNDVGTDYIRERQYAVPGVVEFRGLDLCHLTRLTPSQTKQNELKTCKFWCTSLIIHREIMNFKKKIIELALSASCGSYMVILILYIIEWKISKVLKLKLEISLSNENPSCSTWNFGNILYNSSLPHINLEKPPAPSANISRPFDLIWQ